MELSKLERKLLDNYNELRVISKIRKGLYHLFVGDFENGTEDYYSASEMLNELEGKIWDEIYGCKEKEV